MPSDNEFAQWASLFLSACAEPAELVGADELAGLDDPAEQYGGLTRSARDLLLSIDAGGVPAFVTSNLRQIALDNGVEVGSQWTPNDIVAAIRSKVGR